MGMKKLQRKEEGEEQVTRGHNIVAEGWAGASYPHPYPMPLSQTQKKTSKTLNFALFVSTDQRTNGPTDQLNDGRTKPLTELRVRN